MIAIEGIYSMEGEMCPLKEIIALKKKYKCYLYVDEAHSIGALGANGRGICEHLGVDPADVDILMGTFTKSFGAVGGYIASDADVISLLKARSAGFINSGSISTPAVQQCISSLRIIAGEDGTDLGQQKITALRRNSNYFRKRLMDMGLHVLGDWGSPIMPVLFYQTSKGFIFARGCRKEGLAVVLVGWPATQFDTVRARFCISAAHTKQDMEESLAIIEKYAKRAEVQFNHY